MSSEAPVNCASYAQKNPTPAEAKRRQTILKDAKRRLALLNGCKQSKAANEARNFEARQNAWEMSSKKTFLGAATWQKPPKAEPKAPAPAPAKAQPKAPAPAPTKSPWTKVGRKKKKKPKAQAKKVLLPLPDFIASLKKQVKVLNQKKANALRDGKPKDAQYFRQKIYLLRGMMKRAEERQRQEALDNWNTKQGGLREKNTLGQCLKSKRK